ATFGRGFYILDDFTPLREVTADLLEKDAHIFPVKDALMYVQQRGRSNQGSTYHTADNPPFGATFSYFLKETPKMVQQKRQEEEKKLFKEGERIPQPTWDEQREEELEEKPHLIFSITDDGGNPVRRLTTPARQGLSRITWDLRYSSPRPVRLRGNTFNPTADDTSGFLAMPGRYTVSLHLYHGGELKQLAGPVDFTARVLDNTTLPAPDRAELVAFQKEMSEMARAIMGTESFAEELAQRAEYIKQALYQTPGAPDELMQRARRLARDVDDILFQINGPRAKASSEEIPPRPASINSRLRAMMYAQWRSTSRVTGTQRDAFAILKEEFPPLRQKLQQLHDGELKAIEREMEELGAPWTPGRLPDWKF
ncbi:MAG: glycosyl hydrolase, partial [Acidobacteria bacterium]|nr:glycosyl hydrolase [Acidobacteriota bacterium]